MGLGQMGSRYARRYLEAGFAVTVWNRTPDKAKPLASAGARAVHSPAAALAASEVVIVALENAGALEGTLLTPETRSHLRAAHLVIDTSTVHPEAARRACAVLAEHGCSYLDAPVSGGTNGAARGTLSILVGGDEGVFERARPALEVLGTPHRIGGTGAGQIAKLVNQVIVAITIGAVAEGLFLAERAGIDSGKLLTALRGGFADSRILREHGDRMVRRDFRPGAANRIFCKDLAAIEKLAADVAAVLPLSTRATSAFAALIAAGQAESDHSSYFNYLALVNSDPLTAGDRRST